MQGAKAMQRPFRPLAAKHEADPFAALSARDADHHHLGRRGVPGDRQPVDPVVEPSEGNGPAAGRGQDPRGTQPRPGRARPERQGLRGPGREDLRDLRAAAPLQRHDARPDEQDRHQRHPDADPVPPRCAAESRLHQGRQPHRDDRQHGQGLCARRRRLRADHDLAEEIGGQSRARHAPRARTVRAEQSSCVASAIPASPICSARPP